MSFMRHFNRLCALRDGLETKLDMQDCFSDDPFSDRSEEMREKITELSQEIIALEQRRSLAQWRSAP